MGLDYLEKYDIAGEAQAGILGQVKNYTLATAADTVTSIWNSLPLTPRVETEDLLNAVDRDSAAFFKENRDTVETSSLVAGALIPGLVGLKLLNRARAGLTALGYTENYVGAAFSGQKQKILSTEIAKIFADSGAGTAAYKEATRKMFAANVTKEVIDNAVIELAVIGAMNAHPMMEDYLKDPLQNFALGVAFGAGIGGLMAYPATRRELREITSPIATEALFKVGVKSKQRHVDESFTAAAKFQAYSANIMRYEAILEDTSLNGIEKQLAGDFLNNDKARRAAVLNGVGDWVEHAPAAVKDEITKILQDPRFIGVDKIRFYDLDKSVFKNAATLEIVSPTTAIGKDLKKWNEILKQSGDTKQVMLNTFVSEEGKAEMAFVRLSSGEIFHPTGARNAALAVDIKTAQAELKISNTDYNKVTTPVNNWGEDNLLRSISSARADLRTLEELKLFSRLPEEKLAHIAIDPTDLPRMNGLLSAVGQLTAEQRGKLNIHLRSDMPSYQAVQQFISTRSVVGKNYAAEAKAIVNNKDNSVYYTQLSDGAHKLLSDFVGGHLGPLNRAMDAHLRKLTLPAAERGNESFGKEIWDAGIKTRAAFRKIADSEGYVYLYRGMRGVAHGHRSVESYTVSGAAKAAQFGDPNIRRVHVDNIIGSVQNPSYPTEMEVIVGPSHHEIVNSIPTETGATKAIHIPGATVNEQQITIDQLAEHHMLATQKQVTDMLTQGFSREEISARLNIKKDAIEALDGGGTLKQLNESNFEWRRYTDADRVEEYLGPEHKLYAVVGNKYKNQAAEGLANLDARTYANALKTIVENTTLASDSILAKEALDIYSSKGVKMWVDDMMLHIAEINNQNVGTARFQSADNLLRNIKRNDVITYIGKEIINKTDTIKKRLLNPLADAWLPLQSAPAKLAEFNAVTNKLYSLEGWRDIVKLPEVEGQKPKWQIVQRDKAGDLIPVTHPNGSVYLINQEDVANALEAMREPSRELLKLHNLNRSLLGQAPLNDLGYWIPPMNLVGKNYAYVLDNSGKLGTRILTAGTDAELQQLVRAFEKENTNEHIKVIPKGKQAEHNLAANYTDFELYTTYANVSYQHKGSATLAITPSDSRFLQNMMASYENLILNGVRRYSDIYLNDVTSWLDKLSGYYRAYSKDQPKTTTKETVHDSAMAVKNILLGRDQLEQDVPLKAANSFVDMMLNRAFGKVNNFLSANKVPNKEFYDGLVKELKDSGVEPIWKSFDEYAATSIGEGKNVAPTIVSAGNGLLATMQLRMFEVAQAAVNIMSLPILTWSALMEKLPGTAVAADGSQTLKFPLRVMYAGIRQMFSEEGRRLEKEIWIPRGHINQATRQYTDVVGDLKAATVGGERGDKALQSLINFQNSGAVKLLSTPSDFAEQFTRRITMHTGYWAAKQAYPGIDEMGATVAAISFTDRAIGNYHAAQRPTFFQGTLGSAIGLYQTYFLTFAQHVYRGIESRNFTQLAGLSAIQGGLFGMSSWPGFNLLSENIVGRMNDKHYDLTTGTFRAADKHVAELILYGLPSSLGPAFYTRGDISPRIPSTMGDIAVLNGVKEGWKAAHTIASKASQGLNDGTPIQGLFEALSLQSINRPIARWSELVTGASVTSQGNTVSPQNDVWTPVGVMSRLLAVRPIEEQVVRNARHLDTYYGQIDHEDRQDAMNRIKTATRAGNLNEKVVSEVAADYFRKGGSSKGWTSAINQALVTSEEGTQLSLLRKLEPDSPIMHMVRDMY